MRARTIPGSVWPLDIITFNPFGYLLPWPLVVFLHTHADWGSGEEARGLYRSLQNSLEFFLCDAVSNQALCSANSSHLVSQLQRLNSGRPQCPTWGSPLPKMPGNSLQAITWVHHRTHLICFLSLFFIVQCPMSNMLKTAALNLCSVFLLLFQGTSSPCYSIYAESDHF